MDYRELDCNIIEFVVNSHDDLFVGGRLGSECIVRRTGV